MGNENLSLSERETHISQCADDRTKWEVYTDDSVMIARLNKIADGTPHGAGMKYTITDKQLSLRKERKISLAERDRLAKQARENFSHGTTPEIKA